MYYEYIPISKTKQVLTFVKIELYFQLNFYTSTKIIFQIMITFNY